MLSIILSILGVLCNLLAAFIFASTWLLTDNKMRELSRTKYGGNQSLLDLLRSNKKSTYLGLTLLAFGSVLYILSSIVSVLDC